MDNRKYIINLFRVVSMYSIVYIDSSGNIIRIYCPFSVKKRELYDSEIEQKYIVEAVKMNLELIEVYIIDGLAYYARDFILVV